jgi:hypothetical protein
LRQISTGYVFAGHPKSLVRRCPHKGRGLRGIFLLKLEHKSFEVLRHVRGKHIIVQAPQRVPEDEGRLLLGET